MLDSQRRLSIPKELKTFKEVVYIYYSQAEKLFYISEKEIKEEHLVAKRQIDSKNRLFVPKFVIEFYGTNKIFCSRKADKVYMLYQQDF